MRLWRIWRVKMGNHGEPKYVHGDKSPEQKEKEKKARKSEKMNNVWSKQVGGMHYKQYEIQPFEFFHRNKIPHHKAAIIRRILRYDQPTGKGRQDLEKIRHELDLIMDLEGMDSHAGCGCRDIPVTEQEDKAWESKRPSDMPAGPEMTTT